LAGNGGIRPVSYAGEYRRAFVNLDDGILLLGLGKGKLYRPIRQVAAVHHPYHLVPVVGVCNVKEYFRLGSGTNGRHHALVYLLKLLMG
jgi:hypothetical protein